ELAGLRFVGKHIDRQPRLDRDKRRLSWSKLPGPRGADLFGCNASRPWRLVVSRLDATAGRRGRARRAVSCPWAINIWLSRRGGVGGLSVVRRRLSIVGICVGISWR